MMRTAKETIFVWQRAKDEEVLELVKKAVKDFRKIDLELEEIELTFGQAKGKNDCQEEIEEQAKKELSDKQ